LRPNEFAFTYCLARNKKKAAQKIFFDGQSVYNAGSRQDV
jgi:hypothetical protein